MNVVLGDVSRHNLRAEADQVGLLFVLHRFSPVAGSPAEILRGAGAKALAVEDSRHYDIRPTATRLLVLALIFDELFPPWGQPTHLKGGASRPSFTSHHERPVLIGCR